MTWMRLLGSWYLGGYAIHPLVGDTRCRQDPRLRWEVARRISRGPRKGKYCPLGRTWRFHTLAIAKEAVHRALAWEASR